MLTGPQIQDYAHRIALQQPEAERAYPFGPDHAVYRVRGKMFMMLTDQPGYPGVTLKTDPEENRVLQLAHPSIQGGWHMNKRHWLSLAQGETIDKTLIRELVEDAYLRIVLALPRSKRPPEYRHRS